MELEVWHGRSVVNWGRYVFIVRRGTAAAGHVRDVLEGLPLLLQLLGELKLPLLAIRHVRSSTLKFFLLELEKLTFDSEHLLQKLLITNDVHIF